MMVHLPLLFAAKNFPGLISHAQYDKTLYEWYNDTPISKACRQKLFLDQLTTHSMTKPG
jgi:hypothetical protein